MITTQLGSKIHGYDYRRIQSITWFLLQCSCRRTWPVGAPSWSSNTFACSIYLLVWCLLLIRPLLPSWNYSLQYKSTCFYIWICLFDVQCLPDNREWQSTERFHTAWHDLAEATIAFEVRISWSEISTSQIIRCCGFAFFVRHWACYCCILPFLGVCA